MINIFVEGIADEKFIKDYLSYLNISNDFKVIKTNGKDNLLDFLNIFEKNTDLEGVNLIVFDADEDFNERKQEILNFREFNNIDFELFLFPNNEDKGDLETLLENIIPEDNKNIINCWDNYENCIGKLSKNLTIPANKTKIYAYLEVLLGKTQEEKKKIKERSRDYKNKKHWNLNSDYLLNLKNFLLDNIIEKEKII